MRIEFSKKYAGSVFGLFWVVLYPTLLLGIYMFVFVGIFKLRYNGSVTEYVLILFCGIIPFLGITEAMMSGCQSIKQNIHLVKNVIFPIELIPVRVVFVSIISEIVGLGIILILVTLFGFLSPHVLWLPIVLLFQCLFLIGLVWILSVMAVFLQDVAQFIALSTFALMFMAPVCYTLDNVNNGWQKVIIFFNPITYVVEMFRHSLFYPGTAKGPAWPDPLLCAAYVIMCVAMFTLGALFFMRFKDLLVDYE